MPTTNHKKRTPSLTAKLQYRISTETHDGLRSLAERESVRLGMHVGIADLVRKFVTEGLARAIGVSQ